VFIGGIRTGLAWLHEIPELDGIVIDDNSRHSFMDIAGDRFVVRVAV